jgi:chromate transporter
MSDDATEIKVPKSPRELFQAFNRLALQGFGGVLPVAQRELVERRGWLTRAQFVELLSVGQVLPGPNVVNMALMFGDRHFGWRGAAAALAGLLAGPTAIVLIAAAFYGQLAHYPAVAGALRGMGAVAAGLITATAFKLAGSLKRNLLGAPTVAALVLVTFILVGIVRVPLVAVVLGLGPLAVALAWWRIGNPLR